MGLFTGQKAAASAIQRPALASQNASRYVVLPVVEGHFRDLLMWEVGRPGVIMRGGRPDRTSVEMGTSYARMMFHDREVAEDLAAALNAGRTARGMAVAPEQSKPKSWWRFW